MAEPIVDNPLRTRAATRRNLGLFVALVGAGVHMLGLRPEWFGLARSPAVGLVQLLVFLTGLGLVVFGGWLHIAARWNDVLPLPFVADVGLRLALTGYVLVVIAALADILGFGSHPNPSEAYFGPWQAAGILLGEGLMLVGFLLAWPWHSSAFPASEATS